MRAVKLKAMLPSPVSVLTMTLSLRASVLRQRLLPNTRPSLMLSKRAVLHLKRMQLLHRKSTPCRRKQRRMKRGAKRWQLRKRGSQRSVMRKKLDG